MMTFQLQELVLTAAGGRRGASNRTDRGLLSGPGSVTILRVSYIRTTENDRYLVLFASSSGGV
jgi:hypothetical protein